MEHPREHDILAFIEGELDAVAMRDVESLIASDPSLQQFVDGARADREILLRWGQPGTTLAPQGLVRDAIRHAERDALLDTPIVIKRGILASVGTPRLAAAAAVLLAAGVGIVLGPALLQQNNPNPQPATIDTLATSQQPAETTKDESNKLLRKSQNASDQFAVASLDQPEAALEMQSVPGSLSLADAQDTEGRLDAGAYRQRASAPTGDAALQESMRELAFENESDDTGIDTDTLASLEESDVLAKAGFGEELAQKRVNEPSITDSLTAIGPNRLEAANAPHAMSLSDAWKLATHHTLQISLASPDPASLAAALVARPDIQAIPLKDEPAPGIVASTRTVLVIRLKAHQHALVSLLDTLQTFEISALSMQRADAPVRVPSTIDEILWWTAPSQQWSKAAPLAVMLTIERQAPAADAAPETNPLDTDSR